MQESFSRAICSIGNSSSIFPPAFITASAKASTICPYPFFGYRKVLPVGDDDRIKRLIIASGEEAETRLRASSPSISLG